MADAAKTLASAPVSEIIRSMASSIADAQEELDARSRKSAAALAAEEVTLKDRSGTEHTRTLLELGFTPTFYSFVTVDLELSLETRITEETDVGGEIGANVNRDATETSATSMGMTMSANFQRKFGVETSGQTRMAAQLVALPPPPAFLDFLTELNTAANPADPGGDG
jgi:hypothetical protein